MKLLTIALAAAFTLVTVPADAANDETQISINYADLDLTKAQGRATLDQRIDKAISRACRVRFSRSVRIATQTRDCIREAKDRIAPIRADVVAKAMESKRRNSLAANPR